VSSLSFAGVVSLVQVLHRWAREEPGRRAYTFLADGEDDERTLHYAELDLRVRAVAARLQALGLAGERVLLLFPPGLDYPVALLGCLAAGAVAVPAYPPTGSRGVPRLQAILADCAPRCILTTAALRPVVERLEVAALCLEIDSIEVAKADGYRKAGLTADTLAFLQYTSGSTGTPKGVMVSHGNLVANEKIIQEAIRSDESSVMVSWLPLYHDMGLIGGLLHPLWLGSSCVLMAPLHFLQRPLRWLKAISRYGGVVSGAPNFAYELCARKIAPEDLAGLDLSRWRVAFNGAEPVRAEALERFAEAFAPAGFRSSSFLPCYGLAETTLMVSGSRFHPEVTVYAADASRRLVSCGGIPSGVDLRIVDPSTRLPTEGEGEVWVAGATVTHGYWNLPEATAETFHARLADGQGPYLCTGDLGVLRGGELFITGRIKDLIIIRGRNLYPQDVEWTAARSHPAARPDCGAAFTVDTGGEERLVLVQEVAFRGADLGEVATAIRRAVAEEHEVPVSALVLVKPGGVPKTTSGKIQRRECRQLFLTGGLVPLGEWRDGEGDETRERLASKTPPRTPAEERLAMIWEEVLGLAPGTVGAEDNFFALGGDSLRGTQLLARLQEALGAEVSLEELFEAPTLADLAAKLEAPVLGAPASLPAPFLEAPGKDAGAPSGAPLTSPQRRLWFLDQLEPGNPAYNLGIAVRLTGALDADALAQALAEIVRRHEALRTVFRVLDDVPAQVVLPVDAVAIQLARVDVSVDAEPARAALDLERELAREPFELDHGPLLRARLVGLAADEHELHVAVHHIVSDGWSFGVLLRELAALYGAFSQDLPSPLPELPVQYGDYARWLESQLAGDAVEPQIALWKRRLGGHLPVLELPSDRPRPALPSYRGAHATHVLPMALAGALRGLAGRRGSSLFMALAAGFQALLGRLTTQDDLIVGTAVANRDRVELEGLIGFFVNTVPLRTNLSGDPSFDILLERVRGTVLETLAGREVPFERLVDELRIRRDLSVPPIVQVMLVLQNEPLEAPPVPGLALRGRETDNGTARFDLSVSLLDTEEGLAAVFKYSRDLFDAATIERMARHFERLLAGAVAAPESRLSELPLLSAAERQQIVVDWNATDAPALTEAGCLHELIEAQVERTPEAVAVTCEGESLTYRELDCRANQLAQHLRRLGVAPEVLVGVAVERSVELMVGLLGVLKAGGAYVPLDPSYPAERLAFMVEDAEVAVLLTQDRLLGSVPAGRAAVVCLGEKDFKDLKDVKDSKDVSSGNAAYCIYTSGSTGRPKGALNTHRGIVNRLLWMQAEYGLVPGEGVLQKTPISFDVSVWELFWPLLVGARVVFARHGGHQDSAYLAELIQRETITTLHFVPSMLQVFLEEPRLGACSCLRRVITSGEALPRELEERFGALLGAELHNLYGPTEAAVDVTYWPCLREPEARTVPIGRPISNLRIHLLDPAGEPVPVGVPGHLHIGGAGLARGYWKRPELTAERFVPDPFVPGGRLYATGDLARRRPDGVIEFLGRIDHQVKIRGFRIELGEIEAALNAHPAVRESVVVALTEASGSRRLVAYLVGMGGAAPDLDELRASLAGRLPEYMVPSAFVVLPAFPLNPSGKVDRKALPAPEDPRRSEETPWIAPRTPVEERLAAIWRELLGVEQVGVLDDFFALGGDSIQGALLINRLQRELNAILYVMALFDAPTVGQLASYLEEKYRDALVAAGWIMPGEGEADVAGPADAATEAAEVATLTHHLATRFSPAAGRHGAAEARNRPAVFLLSPFRSGSTLLRVMLAGHPGLFAPPELELLGFETMGERRRVFSGRDSFSREGLLRAVMELRACDAETAAALLEEAEERDEATPAFYRRLQEWVGGRLLVDKTPRYALDLPTLRRAEDWFEAPLYVHLVRHPVATMQSYLEARMQEVYRFPLPQQRQAELVWRLGHANVLEHLAAVPAVRQHRILFEEMVRDPRSAMEDLCAFLGIDFAPAMLSPYEGERMTDGLHGAGRMMGDPKFHQHRGIDAGVADRWRDAPEAAWLGDATWGLAARLGYEAPALLAPAAVGPRPLERPHVGEIDLPLSFAQQRLWFLSRLESGSAYNMPAALRLGGALDVAALAATCAEIERRHEVLRTVFPSAAGRPRQVVWEPRRELLPVIDLAALPEAARRAEAERLTAAEVHRPFDLDAGPLWRVALLRLARAEHVLLVNLHHVVCDGWSVGLLSRELAALYAAFHEGRPSPLPELPLQYADYAAWQRERLSGPVLEELLRYWTERLAGSPPVLELPLDRPRPAVQSFRGARLSLDLPPTLVDGLRELGRGEGATLFMVLAAAFQTLLSRYSRQDDVLIGTPVAARNRAEIEPLIGLFVNTLVLRSDLSGEPSFRALLAQVRRVSLGAARHEEMPFERLVEELHVERSLGHSPLFTVMLALQNAPPARLALPGLDLERLEIDFGTSRFDLTLDVTERPDGGLLASAEYASDLFDAETVRRFLRCFHVLLDGAATSPELALGDLPLLSPAESAEVVAAAAGPVAEIPAVPIHARVAEQARRQSAALAIQGEESLTYGELDELAGRLAAALRRRGVGPEAVVALLLERSPALVAVAWGTLRAGGAYLPIDPAQPEERVLHMLRDSGACVLVTTAAQRGGLSAIPLPEESVLLVDRLLEAGRAAGIETAGPDALAYVIYTSGSTGLPKGTELCHGGLANLCAWHQRVYALTPEDRCSLLAGPGFDASVWEIWPVLSAGASLHIPPPELILQPRQLLGWLAERRITVAFLPTPLAEAMLAEPRPAGLALRAVLTGGDRLHRRPPRVLPYLLINHYGPTEDTVVATAGVVQPEGEGAPSIGGPIDNQAAYVLDRALRPVPPGVPGELCLGGRGLARGYRGRPNLTAAAFVPAPGSRLYRTGDLVRRLPNGEIEFLGRADHQVKIRGLRVELGEIEAALKRHPAVGEAVVMARGERNEMRLVGYVQAAGVDEAGRTALIAGLRQSLQAALPAYMVPAVLVVLDELPFTPSGKVDRRSLPDPGAAASTAPHASPRTEVERTIAQVWLEVLKVERVGLDDNFFDLGGHSLLAAEVHGKLRERIATDLPLIELFRHPTVRALAGRIGGQEAPRDRLAGLRNLARREAAVESDDIAIVGMAGRFPGAPDLDALWRNLRDGVESISFFSDAELAAGGVDPALLTNPRYVRARAVLDGIELFDAQTFGLSPREAAITDPQQRLLLECAWEALETAGLDAETFPGRIGIYAGSVFSTYLVSHLLPQAAPDESWPMVVANDKDTLATRVAYKLNLRGPSLNVQTACSTSLVAVHLARQALLGHECDAALAGGVSVRSQQTSGYLFQEEGILSPDGHCRPFDARARGTLFGSGVGLVVLKRLSDALAHGDTIHAVIKSSAINNDGSDKVGFMAPSPEGQAEVIARALALGGIDPETVTYVETHGTATPLGDPIEVAGLTRAFRASGAERNGYCAIGSVKSNFGHLDAAAGVAGLIKTVLALKHRQIPPSLHFEEPNPHIDFAASPFFVNDRLRPWETEGPRRAGVSAFGIGGANAHVILEEAPAPAPVSAARPLSLLLLSARTARALDGARERLRAHLEHHPDVDVADAAYTTQTGRRSFAHRAAVLAGSVKEAVARLGENDPNFVLSGLAEEGERLVAFLFPGVGEHYPGMAADLYRHEEVFRRELDRCAELLRPVLGTDLREILYPPEAGPAPAGQGMDLRRLLRRGGEEIPGQAALTRTSLAQPAVFAVEYALARLWMSWGLRPQALLGYSLGEYVAACIAGVLSLEDAVALVGLRARLIEALPAGRMLAVALPEADLRPLLGEGLWVGAANGPDETVVSGEPEAVAALQQRLAELEVPAVPVAASHAFHSEMLRPAAAELTTAASKASLGAPSIPYVSNLTGRWITAEEARDPGYWARHMCEAVRFTEGLDLLLADPTLVLLEVGPGQALATLARRSARKTGHHLVLTSLRHRDEARPDLQPALASLGRMWAAGVPVDWRAFHAGERRRVVPLPTYPFDRRRHWVEAPRGSAPAASIPEAASDPSEWLHLPSLRPAAVSDASGGWLVRLDGGSAGSALAEQLRQAGFDVERIAPAGEADAGLGDDPAAHRIAAIWREVLGVERIGPRDRFFDLGGDSLIALRVMARLREAFGVDLPVRALFEHPTVPGLRDAVAEARTGRETAAAAGGAIPRRTTDGPVPLAFLQEQLWFLHQLDPASAAYNVRAQARLTGRLDRSALLQALRAIVARHETLRTVFRTEAGTPVQMVLPHVEIDLPSIDLTGLPPERREPEKARHALGEAERAFDLGQGPLVRCFLVRLAADVHVLILTTHHIVFDAVSQGVMLRELGQLYAAFAQGEAPALPPLPIQFADYAVWQHASLAKSLDEDLEYWRRQLAGAPAGLDLPTDRPRPPVQRFRGASTTWPVLGPEVTEKLNALARGESVTLFTLLLGTLDAVLLRTTGQTDLLVGTPVTGRHVRELEGLVGLFLNTVVLRGDLSGNPSFRALLGRLRRTVLEAFDHQALPFERVVEDLRPDRDLGRNPFFQVIFAFHTTLVREMALPGLALRTEDPESRTSNLDLTLHVREWDGEIGALLEYSTDLFDATTAQRLLAHWAALLHGVIEAPDRPLSELPFLLPEERQQAVLEWNDTAARYPTDLCLHELIAAQATRTPNAVAASFEGEELTYAGLVARARGLARELAAWGVRPDAPVGVLMERSLEMIVALLGILEAGAAYVPLDPTLPAERLKAVIESAGISVVTVETPRGASPSVVSAAALRSLGMEETAAGDAPRGVSTVAGGTGRSAGLAYVIYTSGSTGTPKGVMVPHKGIVNRLLWMQEAYKLTPDDRVLQKTPFGFDVSVWEFFWPLIVGARLVFARPEGHKDPVYLAELIPREKITTLHFVPSMLQAFLESAPGLEALTSLRKVMASGEALPPDLVRRFFARLPHAELHNLYGPTEASVDVSFWPAVPEPPRSVVPIGRPIANLRLHVVDRHLRPQPIGVAGELLLGGVGLARGYLGRPELTAAAFVPDPFAAEPGSRLYRTGDLTRSLSDGNIEYLGRIDHQVKIRGFRIELGEIEVVLASHPAVRECVVVAREGALAGYVVLDRSDAKTTLAAWLRDRLPEYMVPAAFVVLEALPLSPNGKVDRKALPAPEPGRAEVAFVAPSDPVEELLAGLWAERLGIERIGVHDNVFDLGGHSLMATQVRTRIADLLSVDLPLRKLFESPTIARLAQAVREAREEETAPQQPLVPLAPETRREGMRLSFSQQRLWLLDQIEPGSAAYNVPSAVRLSGALDPGLLAQVFAALVQRHEVLRTTFAARPDGPVQVIAPASAPDLPLVDLGDLPAAEREARARDLARSEARRPFDLRRGPLLRLTLLRLETQEHLLLMTFHHVVSDGWSWGVLLREVAALYEAFAEGRPSPLPDLPVQYADFAVWQRGWLQGETLERQLAWWTRQLAGAPRVLELPTDRPRPVLPSRRGGVRRTVLSTALSAEISGLCRRQGVTPFMALLAAWSLLLGRHAGQEEVLVGSPVAGRNRREIEELIGLFINTLVLRTDLTEGPSFAGLLGRVREMAIDAFSHQDLPFERLVEELAADRDLRRAPVFQVLFILQNAPLGALELPGLTLRLVPVDWDAAKFDLTLNLEETAGRFSGWLEYDADLFDAATAERLLARYERLLASAVEAPEASIRELGLLPEAERHQVLHEHNDRAEDYPADLCMHELFEAQAARTPDAVAISGAGRTLRYGELADLSDQLARRLAALGVGPETPVGVCAERTPALLVALLGVLKAGGAYVPLDPTHPRERLGYILADSGAPVLLTERALHEAMTFDAEQVVLLDEAAEDEGRWRPLSRSVGGRWERGTGGEVPAYVIYTSGSTGRPKGVAVRHRGVVNYLATMARRPGLAADDVIMAVTTVAFDIAVTELFLPLLVGARIEMVSRETASDAALLAAAIGAAGATCMQATPATWTLLVDGGWAGRPGLKALCGGEALPRALADKLLPRVGELWNVYGPTETTVWSALLRVGAGDRPVPVGPPLGNTTLHLLARHDELAPLGVAGELAIGGDGLARGYHSRPDLTAERFVPDLFADAPGSRLYRTGDLARRLPDGTLEFLGRIDHQVKVRGFRIELGEIEAILATHPAVRECVVAARQDAPGDVRLVGYVVPLAEAAPDAAELRRFLAGTLPPYMVPAAFVALPALPLNPNGKIDRKALPAPERPEAEGVPTAPRSEEERLIAQAWAEVLGREQVGIHDDFFALGGHSLLATRVVSRLRELLSVELGVRKLFEAPTVEELARAVRAARAEGPAQAPPLVPLPPQLRQGELPLSFAQQRIWLLDQIEPGGAAYNLPTALRLTGEVSAARLERIFAEVIRRHEALRTTFPAREGRPVQVVDPAAPPRLPVVDLSALPAAAREELARGLALAEALRPFDLQRDPLLRLTLVRLEEDGCLLLITIHHIVADAWSLGVLLREIAALWADPHAPGLPELPVQYADFAVWQRSWLQGEVLEGQLGHWKRRLAGAPRVLELPTDRPRPAVSSHRGGLRHLALTPALSDAIAGLCRTQGVTPFMVLLAAWGVLLGRRAGQEDVLVGSPVAGRTRREVEDLIGLFINTLVLRTEWTAGPSFGELLGRVRETALDALTNQDLPFERLVDELAPDRDLSRSPVFQAFFILQNAPLGALELPGLTLRQLPLQGGTAKFDLTLNLMETESGIAGWLEHDADLFDAATAERLAAHYERLLQVVTAAPEASVRHLPLTPEAERHQILYEHNDAAAAYPSDLCVHELVAAQAARTPDTVAVSGAGRTLRYGELEALAERLAGRLAALGVGPEVLVGIYAERTPSLLVALLGVLKAGGAYVPLDPTHPKERLGYILEDSGARVLLTENSLLDALPPHAAQVVLLDFAEGDARRAPLPSAGPENPAYVIYTSGSTGRPKGVEVRHRGVVNYLATMAARPGLAAGDVMIAVTTLAFDIAVTELLLPLTVGARVELVGRETSGDATLLAATIDVAGATCMQATPATWTLLVEGGWPGRPGLKALCGGEALPRTLADKLLPRVGELWNVYGPTETTVWSALLRVGSGDRPVPVGLPLGNTTLHLLARHDELAPLGVAGELAIGGYGLARGYHGRPDLTAERFVPDPFAEVSGARLYRTGDLARRLPDGTLEFLGRIDHQVKVRGFRIELGEIEAVLASHPAVRECVVVARQDGPGDKRLVGYVVPQAGASPELSELRGFLGEKLPPYMVPAAFMTLDALPLSPNGKVDRKALPAPGRERAERGEDLPLTPTEAALARIWEQVLGAAAVGPHDSFFELGGDSILAVQVVFRAHEAGLTLSPQDLFRHQVLGELAAVVEAAATKTGGEAPEDGEISLTPAQQRFFGLNLAEPNRFNQALLLTLREPVAPERLDWALGVVVGLHPALRVHFVRGESGAWRQMPALWLIPPLEILDLSALPAAERRAALEAATERLQGSLDIGRGPLLRAVLCWLGDGEERLFLVLHHLIVDSASWRILLADLEAACRAASAGTAAALPSPATSLRQWGARLAEHAQSAAGNEELGWWLGRDRSVRPLPLDRPEGRGANTVASARRLLVELSEEETRSLLSDVPAVYNTRLEDALLTALVQAFAVWTGEPRLLIDLEGSGRDGFGGADLSRTVGWLAPLYPVVLELDRRERDPGAMLKAVKEQLREVPRGGWSYGALRLENGAPVVLRDAGPLPPGEPEFTLFAAAPESAGAPAGPREERPWLLEIDSGIAEGRLRCAWTWSASLHEERTIQGLADRFAGALRTLIEHSRTAGAGGFTPIDFPTARISQKDLDKLMGRIGGKRGAGTRAGGTKTP